MEAQSWEEAGKVESSKRGLCASAAPAYDMSIAVAGHWVPESVLHALCAFATHWKADVPWPSLRELLLIIHQVRNGLEVQKGSEHASKMHDAQLSCVTVQA